MRLRQAIILTATIFSLLIVVAAAEEPPPASLTNAERQMLQDLLRQELFDPQDAQRVRISYKLWSLWGGSEEMEIEAWLKTDKVTGQASIYFTDGESRPAPPAAKIKKIDFLAEYRKQYEPKKNEDDDNERIFAAMRMNAVGAQQAEHLEVAAWALRLGDPQLAAQALTAARQRSEDPLKSLRDSLAWRTYSQVVHAYMHRADAEAWEHAEWLTKRYPDIVELGYEQAPLLVAELKRRRDAGTAGKTPPEKWPDGFDKWEVDRKIKYLIEALDEVDARQHGQPGGVDLASDRRVEALIRIGDAAVPALIDVIEKDERFTRSVHFWRDFSTDRTVLGVREAALTAVMSILRVSSFEAVSTGDNFTKRGADAAKQQAADLRAYWKEFGALPFDERMMRTLTDVRRDFDARYEAAFNLAYPDAHRRISTTVWSGSSSQPEERKPNPAIAKFKNPTTAEAMLAALDAELEHIAKTKDEKNSLSDYKTKQAAGRYADLLTELKDDRIGDEIERRAVEAADDMSLRITWSAAARQLGRPKPFAQLVEEFRTGKLEIAEPDSNRSEGDPLIGVVTALVAAASPEADRALEAAAEKSHPYYLRLQEKTFSPRHGFDEFAWFRHPSCLKVLRETLENTVSTAAVYTVTDTAVEKRYAGGASSSSIPEFLADSGVRREKADERVCDAAAMKVRELVLGAPLYHPLFKDSERRLTEIKSFLRRFDGKFRPATLAECMAAGETFWDPHFLFDLPPLDRAATADDVATGKAIFHLERPGKPPAMELPAVGEFPVPAEQLHKPKALILQAERDEAGATTYGILTSNGIETLPADELTNIRSLKQFEAELKAESERRHAAREQ